MAPAFSQFVAAIDADAHLAYARLWGTVTGGEMLEVIEAVHRDAAWRDGFDAIWDCSGVTAHVVGIEEMQPLVDEEAASGDGQDALIESPGLGESAISNLLATFCRRRGKAMTVHISVEAALAAMGRDALPASLANLRA